MVDCGLGAVAIYRAMGSADATAPFSYADRSAEGLCKVIRRYMVWVDDNGFTRLTLVNGNSTLVTVEAELAGKSNASVLNETEGTLTVNIPTPPGGLYRTVGDAAVLTFVDGSGDLVNVTLPAPLSSIFLADQFTVDSAQIAGIIAAVVGTVQSASGSAVTAFLAGVRATKKAESY